MGQRIQFKANVLSTITSQGAIYCIVTCGIRNIRVWFGPLYFEVCFIQIWAKNVMIWYSLNILFFVTLMKFMFLCVWKRMPDMNDNLIVRIFVNWAIFISILVPTTGFANKKGNPDENLCTGTFNDHSRIMNRGKYFFTN